MKSPVFQKRNAKLKCLFAFFIILQGSTTDFMKKVPSVYTHSMKTIYLFLSAQVAEKTIYHMMQIVYIDGTFKHF